jgi:hypothetical protein
MDSGLHLVQDIHFDCKKYTYLKSKFVLDGLKDCSLLCRILATVPICQPTLLTVVAGSKME